MSNEETRFVPDTCDQNSIGGGYQSKENKHSKPIDVKMLGGVLSYNVKDKDGKIVESRDFKIGEYAIFDRDVAPGKDITVKRAKELLAAAAEDPTSVQCGEINSFWTCLDGRDAQAQGAEVARPYGNRRLPLRTLVPMPNPKPKRPGVNDD